MCGHTGYVPIWNTFENFVLLDVRLLHLQPFMDSIYSSSLSRNVPTWDKCIIMLEDYIEKQW
jgi:hypothetical protein